MQPIAYCEGAPDLGEGKKQSFDRKLIGYLVTDFIKLAQ
jgi:hypothetical protein